MPTNIEVLREYMQNDPQRLREALAKIVDIVRNSFADDRRRSRIVLLSDLRPTGPMIRERTELAYDWFMRMRADLGYSTTKALDLLPRALRASLDGEDWDPPPAGRSWSPTER